MWDNDKKIISDNMTKFEDLKEKFTEVINENDAKKQTILPFVSKLVEGLALYLGCDENNIFHFKVNAGHFVENGVSLSESMEFGADSFWHFDLGILINHNEDIAFGVLPVFDIAVNPVNDKYDVKVVRDGEIWREFTINPSEEEYTEFNDFFYSTLEDYIEELKIVRWR